MLRLQHHFLWFIIRLFVANNFFSLFDLDFSFLKRAAADCVSQIFLSLVLMIV